MWLRGSFITNHPEQPGKTGIELGNPAKPDHFPLQNQGKSGGDLEIQTD